MYMRIGIGSQKSPMKERDWTYRLISEDQSLCLRPFQVADYAVVALSSL